MSEEKTPEQRLEALEEGMTSVLDLVEQLTKRITEVDKKAVKKSTGLFGGKRTKTAIKDKTTNKIYPSKAATGKALYGEIEGGDPADHFMWYKLIAKFPDRFEELDAEAPEAKKVWAEEKAQIEKEVEEAQAKLDAEAKAKAEAEAKPKGKGK